MRELKTKECEFCGKSFQPTTGSAKFCGIECRKEAQKKLRAERRLKALIPKKKKKLISIEEIQRIGRAYGLNYGETVFAIERGEISL